MRCVALEACLFFFFSPTTNAPRRLFMAHMQSQPWPASALQYQVWAAYAQFERRFGTTKDVHKVLKTASREVQDFAEAACQVILRRKQVCATPPAAACHTNAMWINHRPHAPFVARQEWLSFEREESGDLQAYLSARRLVEERLAVIAARQQKAAEKQEEAAAKAAAAEAKVHFGPAATAGGALVRDIRLNFFPFLSLPPRQLRAGAAKEGACAGCGLLRASCVETVPPRRGARGWRGWSSEQAGQGVPRPPRWRPAPCAASTLNLRRKLTPLPPCCLSASGAAPGRRRGCRGPGAIPAQRGRCEEDGDCEEPGLRRWRRGAARAVQGCRLDSRYRRA